MQNFDYMTPTRLIFGKESIVKLPSVMAQFGKRILLTYGGGKRKFKIEVQKNRSVA